MLDKLFDSLTASVESPLFKMGIWLVTFIITIIIGFVAIKLLLYFTEKLLRRSKFNPAAVPFVVAVTRIFCYVLLGISITTSLGILETSSIITSLGAVGLAVSLAVKDSLSNLMGGVLLILFKSFGLGDYVEIDGIGGTVAEIGLIHTMLTTVDNKRISIPNGQVTNARIINYSAENTRRVDITLTIDRSSSIEVAKKVLMDIIEEQPLALHEPAPTVHAEGHTDLGTKLCCKVWVNREDYWPLYYDITETLKDRLAQAGVTMPTLLMFK